jgi:hypothetical protein
MTALSVRARPETDRPRPVSWRQMGWVTWRQHRFTLASVAVLVGAMAVWLSILGLRLHHAHAAATACDPISSTACAELISRFNAMDKVLWYGYLLQAVPALIGAFVGAPLLARELETGTFRYAWTQGIGPARWTLAKLTALAITVAAGATALSLLFSWYYQPYLAAGNQTLTLTQWSPLAPGLFDLRGITFAAWTLVAFAIGGLAGVLIRRVVPAIVATLAAYAGLAVAAGLFLRRHYLAPRVTNALDVPASAWISRQWWTVGGRYAFGGRAPVDVLQQICPPSAVGSGKPAPATITQCLVDHGYTHWTSYQPASRFWQYQWIEGGWLLTLSALLIATTVWMVRRHPA